MSEMQPGAALYDLFIYREKPRLSLRVDDFIAVHVFLSGRVGVAIHYYIYIKLVNQVLFCYYAIYKAVQLFPMFIFTCPPMWLCSHFPG